MWSHFKEKSIILPDTNWEEINKQVDPVLRKMETAGILFDSKVFKNMENSIALRIGKLEKKIYDLAGQDFNINSPVQMSDILFKVLNLPIVGLKKNKSGISTAASELEKIIDQHKIIEPILEYRELNKLITTYLKPLPLLVDESSRLHTTYGYDTATSRLTSNEPNLQNIPIKGEFGTEIRKAFVAPSGMKLIAADYSQIELRIVACLGEDRSMIKSFENNEDIHSRTASEIFDIKPEKVTKDQRRIAKSVNFGIVYGQSPYGLSQQLKIAQKDAAEYIFRYFEIHKGIKNYINNMINKAHKDGYVETLFGFRRYLPNINSINFIMRDSEERMAINAPIQGSAAEIIKLAMIELDKKLSVFNKNHKKDLPAQILLTVHDELVVEVPEKTAKEVAEIVRETMENVVKLCIPIDVEVEIGDNWGEMVVIPAS